MIEYLKKLEVTPGVRFVLLVTEDGVPVASPGVELSDLGREVGAHGSIEALAAVATGWLGELEQCVAPVSWRAPRRAVMSGSRGSLVLTAVRHSVLVVLADPALDLEPIRLAIDGIVARYERGTSGSSSPLDGLPSPLPSAGDTSDKSEASSSKDARSHKS